MQVCLVHATTRSACFELQTGTCYKAPAPFEVLLDGQPVLTGAEANVFSLYHLEPARTYRLEVMAGEDCGSLEFTTSTESFFVDASRFGLIADGVSDNTAFLQAALSSCPPGGTVYVPAGTYRTQSLFLCSDTTLYLEKGCTLLGGTDRREYPVLPGVLPCANEKDEFYLGLWEGNPLDSFAGLINVIHAKNVTITGEGCINANADKGDWYENPKERRIAWRPRLFFTNNAENVTLHGVEICNSYSWTIHPTYSCGVNILQLHIHNHASSPNTDGIDPESCRDVNIIGDYVHVGDDCIALKSGKLFLGVVKHIPCENVTIRNCCLSRGHGGLVIGSEMSGGVRNVTVTQCLMDHTDRGLRVKTRRGRGKNAVIDGLVFRNVEMRHVLTPFVINMFYFCDPDGKSDYVQSHDALPLDDATPRLGSLTMENITATDAEYAGCWFSGLPEQPIERVEMRNVSIAFAPDAGAGTAAMMCNADPCKKLAIRAENVRSIALHNVRLEGYEGERLQFTNVESFEEE
ncbi:glycoside hydrolase family 28 protein [bacterium]|nr:glycoside hydrolase family 28 protein [bacterium]